MSPVPLLTDITSLPMHAQLMLALIVGSAVFCLAVVVAGAFRASLLRRKYAAAGLPALPQQFPCAGDQLFTALFITFLLANAATQLIPGAPAPAHETLSWGSVTMGLAIHLGLYTPMLIRYALVHPWHTPSRPAWYYIALPFLAWAGIYLAVGMLEASGFTSWLIEATGCPEHQELITSFTQGDIMQRTYIGISAVIVAPLVEECCFRGFLYTSLKRWGGCTAACLASALLFGSIHASLAQMLPLTLFGIAQCIAYEKSQSLWLPVATHALFNSVSLAVSFLVLTP